MKGQGRFLSVPCMKYHRYLNLNIVDCCSTSLRIQFLEQNAYHSDKNV